MPRQHSGVLKSVALPSARRGTKPDVNSAPVMNDKLWRIVFHEVDRQRLNDFVRLFASRGGPEYCWCMAGAPRQKKPTSKTGPAAYGICECLQKSGLCGSGTRRNPAPCYAIKS